MRDSQPSGSSADGIPALLEILRAIWDGRWVVIGVTGAFGLAAVIFALTATEWYRAEVTLSPAMSRESLSAGLGDLAGLASLAGVQIGGSSDETTEALAVLRSRNFSREFIEAEGLIQVLFEDQWDEESQSWALENESDWPDVRDAVNYFQENVLRIVEDRRTGLVSLAVEWKDPDLASHWANLFAARGNDFIRQRALTEAGANIAFLRRQLEDTQLVSLQQSISNLLETEMRTLMLANAAQQYAFRIVDPAVSPKYRSRPRRTLLVAVAILGGGLLSLTSVLLMYGWRRNWALATP